MPSKNQYDLVQNDDYDTRIPLHSEEAFHQGITFQAKFIGSLDVPRPTSRVEIVAAMRRIRYEFKAKGIKKKKVTIEISIDGVKVTLRKKKKRKQWMEEGKTAFLSHPIYRIFYVSHDSQDMKIFSYIARDGASDFFKCAVFKSNKKNQAMRIVRTVGQAFEVCHKLSITGPENENLDQEEQETSTQDLLSDRLSDTNSEKYRKDRYESDMDRLSFLDCDDSFMKDAQNNKIARLAMSKPIEAIPPPPCSNNNKSTLISSDTYSSPHSDMVPTENGMNSLPLPGSALSAHHEIQLLREQLEQQNQQTQATAAQLHLTREQLAAEQAARMEAQSRTRQLLVHNRELLDHIAALVSHLQTGDKTGVTGTQQQNPAHVTLPQRPGSNIMENYMPDLPEDHSLHQNLGFIENRAATSCLPPSPHQTLNPSGNIFNFPYTQEASFENQLLQRLQCLSGYTTPSSYPFNINSSLPYFQPPYYPNMMNRHFPNYPTSSLASRHSFNDNNIQGIRHNSEPRQMHHYNNTPMTSFKNHNDASQNPNLVPAPQNTRATTPRPSNLIKPLSQIGTLTTTDSGGNVRVIVPVPNTTNNSINNEDDKEGLLANLKLTDDFRMNGPPIQRTTSEKVPNRSELLSQVQRAMWARHTTK